MELFDIERAKKIVRKGYIDDFMVKDLIPLSTVFLLYYTSTIPVLPEFSALHWSSALPCPWTLIFKPTYYFFSPSQTDYTFLTYCWLMNSMPLNGDK